MDAVLKLPVCMIVPAEVAAQAFALLAPYQHQTVNMGWSGDKMKWKCHPPGASESRLSVESITAAEVAMVHLNTEQGDAKE